MSAYGGVRISACENYNIVCNNNCVKKQTFDKKDFEWLIGIDEAGRGPLAGPLSIGAVLVKSKSVSDIFSGIKDSKKLSAKKREVWFERIRIAKMRGELSFSVALISNTEIDQKGLSFCLKNGVSHILERLSIQKEKTLVLLDGSLHAPTSFHHQATLIKGDESESVIAAASIMAKVTRDREMIKLAKKYPKYGFESHKGYGTKAHYEALARYKPSPIHRTTFLKNI